MAKEATAATAAKQAAEADENAREGARTNVQDAFDLPDAGRVNCWAAPIRGEILVPYNGKGGREVIGAFRRLEEAVAGVRAALDNAGIEGVMIGDAFQTTRPVEAFKAEADG